MSYSTACRSNQYKDCLPSETISVIRNILTELGFSMQEVLWQSFENKIFAVSIEDTSSPPSMWRLRSNGKGVSKELALASAYAEFMERLQNVCFPGFLPRRYGLMPTELRAPDEVVKDLRDIASVSNLVSSSLFSRATITKYGNRRMVCVPFYEVTDGKTYYLPEEILYWRCTSNGMCAGNTREEALIQGICEVLERYTARELYLNDISFPTIPLSDLAGLECYETIQRIRELGYHVEVKDCTLGGRFPVVGVLFFDSCGDQYHFHLGSYPLFDIALERCLSETVQGISAPIERGNGLGGLMGPVVWKEGIKKASTPGKWRQKRLRTLYSYYRGRKSEYPPTLMISSGDTLYQRAFLKEFKSNRDTLVFLLGLIRQAGLKLFMRDVSFLGFPSFRVYIPGLSEIFPPSRDDDMLEIVFEVLPQIRKTLLSLAHSSEDDVRVCAESIERVVGHPRFPKNEVSVRWNINLSLNADFHEFANIDYLLALLFIRAGEFGRAFDYMERYWLTQLISGALNNNVERAEYYWCTLAYIGLRAAGNSEEEIERTLEELFGDSRAKEIIRDFRDPEKVFQNFSLPECGVCDGCNISCECRYEEWERLVGFLSAKMRENSIDQRKSFLWLGISK
jgi:ribosomal protein S12 methylthiotransferase accessory factor